MKQQLTLSSIKDLDDGRVEAAFNTAVKTCIQDCMDRPNDDSTRTVTFVAHITPLSENAGICEEVDIDFTVAPKIPKRRSKSYRMIPHPNGAALFNPASDDNPKQSTLDEIDAE